MQTVTVSPTWRAVPAVSGIGVPMRVAMAPVASTTVAVRVPGGSRRPDA